MSLLNSLSDKSVWLQYVAYKLQCGNLSRNEEKDLLNFVAQEEYLSVTSHLDKGLGIPQKRLISKIGTDKKRTVYSFSRSENYLLKLLTYLLLRKYNHIFAHNLYSFRIGHGVREAIEYIRRDRDLRSRYVFKLDIHDYFNSIDIDLLLPMLKQLMTDDEPTYLLIESILRNPNVIDIDGNIISERKGIMAGVPLASFLANLYLSQLDYQFFELGNRYARYSDDIIIFADSAEHRSLMADILLKALESYHLEVNPQKIMFSDPGEPWNFLGIRYHQGIFDISDVSAKKIKDKMRRKSRALMRWAHLKDKSPEKAAKAFIRIFNTKFYQTDDSGDLTWTRWFFPIINTSMTLSNIDAFMQQCIRFIITGRRTKRQFNCRYYHMKDLGYRSLVNEYYRCKKTHNS